MSPLTDGRKHPPSILQCVFFTDWSKMFIFQTLYWFVCNILSRTPNKTDGERKWGTRDYFYLRVFDAGVSKVFFLFVCQAPERFIFHWQCFPLLLTAFIIKCAISSTDFLPEFALYFLYSCCLLTPLFMRSLPVLWVCPASCCSVLKDAKKWVWTL